MRGDQDFRRIRDEAAAQLRRVEADPNAATALVADMGDISRAAIVALLLGVHAADGDPASYLAGMVAGMGVLVEAAPTRVVFVGLAGAE